MHRFRVFGTVRVQWTRAGIGPFCTGRFGPRTDCILVERHQASNTYNSVPNVEDKPDPSLPGPMAGSGSGRFHGSDRGIRGMHRNRTRVRHFPSLFLEQFNFNYFAGWSLISAGLFGHQERFCWITRLLANSATSTSGGSYKMRSWTGSNYKPKPDAVITGASMLNIRCHFRISIFVNS